MTKSIEINFNPSGTRELLYLAASAVILSVSVYLDYVNFQPATSWTQRCGAALVIVGAMSESKHVEKVISPDKGATGAPLTTRQNFVTHSGFITALVGTFLAGYGDLLAKSSVGT